MLTYRRRIPGQEEEVIAIPENTDEPIDLSQDPDDTEYSVDSFEAYMEFVKRVKLERIWITQTRISKSRTGL